MDIAGEMAIVASDMASGSGVRSMVEAVVAHNAGMRHMDCEDLAIEAGQVVGTDDTLDASATDAVLEHWRSSEALTAHGDSCCRLAGKARSARVRVTTFADRGDDDGKG